MYRFGELIRKYRLGQGLSLRVVAAHMDMDQAILSKIECGKRRARRDLVYKLAHYYKQDPEDLLKIWLKDRILDELEGEAHARDVLKAAEEAIAYRKTAIISKSSLLDDYRKIMTKFPSIKRAWVFGSFARNEDDSLSGIDILIEVPEYLPFSLFDMAELREMLQNLSQKKVDLVINRAPQPEILEGVKKERKLFYEA